MAEIKKYSKMDNDERLTNCSKCGGILDYRGLGRYLCESCGNMDYDDFGKVRKFIEDNQKKGRAVNAKEAMAATDVPFDKITHYLREGRIEIVNGSNTYLRCLKCGTQIRSGKYCPSCAEAMPKGSVVLSDIGQRPDARGKMHTNTWEREDWK